MIFKGLRLFSILWYNRGNLDIWRYILKKTYRVKRDKDFRLIFGQGKNAANRKFVVYHLNTNQNHFRVGLSVSKKLGNAVTRNAIKRKLRHVLMEVRNDLKTEDFVLIARKGVEEMDYQEVKRNLLHVLKVADLYEEGSESEEKN